MLSFKELIEEAKRTGCTCWTGYKRVPGTEPCESGSCMKEERGLWDNIHAKQERIKNEEFSEHIEKVKGGYEVESEHGNKNLGKSPTLAGAKKRLKQVEYFKHMGEDVETQFDLIEEQVRVGRVMQFAAKAHELWRNQHIKDKGDVPRIKKNSDGTEGDINVPFHKLHPDWKKENIAAGHAALAAVKKHPRDIEKAAEHVHNEWMKRNPKAEYNASQHKPYKDLPEDEKEKDRVHVRAISSTKNEEVETQFDLIEELVMELAHEHNINPEVIWEKFETIDDEELYEAAVDAKGYKSSTGGLTQKGRDHYNNTDGGHLKAPVTTPPSKLSPNSKAAKRRKSFCARMSGVEGPMRKPNGEPSRKALALRKWNC